MQVLAKALKSPICVVMTVGVLSITVFTGWAVGPSFLNYLKYSPQEGDIVMQSLGHSPLGRMIEGATGSPYSHCGIITHRQGRWVVLEAVGPVKHTPLWGWIWRGRDQMFAVYRFRANYQNSIPDTIQTAGTYLGKPYDQRYRWDDEWIYCSELIYKSFESVTGEQLGKLCRLKDLNWQPYEELMVSLEEGPVPLERRMITPVDMAAAEQLRLAENYGFPE